MVDIESGVAMKRDRSLVLDINQLLSVRISGIDLTEGDGGGSMASMPSSSTSATLGP